VIYHYLFIVYFLLNRFNKICVKLINDIETTNHFMFECPAFQNLTVDFFSDHRHPIW